MKKSMKLVIAVTALTTMTLNLNTVMAQTWTNRSSSEVQSTLAESESGLYIIQWGDTLSIIAEATGYSVTDLAAVNEIADVDMITAGSVLYFNNVNHTVTYVENGTNTATTYDLSEENSTYIVNETAEWVAEQVTEAPVVEETTEAVTEAPVVEETTEAVTEAPVVKETTEAVIEAPVVKETTEAVTEAPVVKETTEAVTEAPVVEEITEAVTEVPAVEETTEAVTEAPVVEETVASVNSGVNEYGGIISDAKEWIAMKESGGNYEIWNPSGTYYGRYQVTVSYLNGDLSRENQERVADNYVLERYGSWEAAKEFWLQNNWY